MKGSARAWFIIPSFRLRPAAVSGHRRRPRKPRNIVITGATMGIGESLALSYAEEGVRWDFHSNRRGSLNCN